APFIRSRDRCSSSGARGRDTMTTDPVTVQLTGSISVTFTSSVDSGGHVTNSFVSWQPQLNVRTVNFSVSAKPSASVSKWSSWNNWNGGDALLAVNGLSIVADVKDIATDVVTIYDDPADVSAWISLGQSSFNALDTLENAGPTEKTLPVSISPFSSE